MNQDLPTLIHQITTNQQFLSDIKTYVDHLSTLKSQPNALVSFAFQKENKYPWSSITNNMPIQGQKMVDDISDLISGIIDHNLHEILNRQFINISNQILIIRDQMTRFTQEINHNHLSMKNQFFAEFEQIKKKMIIQNNMVRDKQFTRTRTTGMLNSSVSSSTTGQNEVRSEMRSAEFEAIKKEIQLMKKQISTFSTMKTANDRITLLQQTLSNQLITFRLKLQSIKQKSQKSHQQLLSKHTQTNSKDYISSQIKRAVKSYFKVYLQQINKCKQNMQKYEQSLVKIDKGLQDYMGNQLKALWLQFSNMKRRVQSLEEFSNLNNQSFIME